MTTSTSNTGDIPSSPFAHRRIAHYHGDIVRILFLASALIMLAAQTTGTSLPFSTIQVVIFAVILVILAGVTNPAQAWIHYLNEVVAVFGAVRFGITAIEEYQGRQNLLDPQYLYVEVLALLFFIAVYFATKTIRGILLRPSLT